MFSGQRFAILAMFDRPGVAGAVLQTASSLLGCSPPSSIQIKEIEKDAIQTVQLNVYKLQTQFSTL